jgi:hypothetical protein
MNWLVFSLMLLTGALGPQTPPAQLSPSQLPRLDAEKEVLTPPFPGLLLTPSAPLRSADGKYGQPYRAVCYGYAALPRPGTEKTPLYVRRFAVYAPDSEFLPLAKRVARLLLLLHGLNRERLGFDHPPDMPVVQVWLTRQAGAGLDAGVGGEQFKNQIYLYDVTAARRPIEWARETAHEYGHFALPGVSGFTAPEAWANGVLGERLFLKWLLEEARAGRLSLETLPFVALEDLTLFETRQIAPLVARVLTAGTDAQRLARRDATGMDDYTGLVMAVDTLYGSSMLRKALLATSPSAEGRFIEAPDFLRGFVTALRSTAEFLMTVPFTPSASLNATLCVYLPSGEYAVEASPGTTAWSLQIGAERLTGDRRLRVRQSGWYALTARRGQEGAVAQLRFRRLPERR